MMSSPSMPDPAPPPRPLKTALLFAGAIAGAYAGAAVITVGLVQFGAPHMDWLANLIEEHGASKIMRRVVLLLVLIALPWLLRAFGWRGWRDCGVFLPGTERVPASWFRRWMRGFGLGLLSLGAVVALVLVVEQRVFDPDVTPGGAVGRFLRYTLSALVVGLVEEILARGILFRLLARQWGAVAGGLVSSLLFAVGHFLRPAEAAFSGDGLLASTAAVLGSMGTAMAARPELGLQLANLTLMGLALCAFVHRSGMVWFVAGLHGGWVWIKLMNGYLADTNRAVSPGFWLGQRSDATDAGLASLVLAGILLYALRTRSSSRDEERL